MARPCLTFDRKVVSHTHTQCPGVRHTATNKAIATVDTMQKLAEGEIDHLEFQDPAMISYLGLSLISLQDRSSRAASRAKVQKASKKSDANIARELVLSGRLCIDAGDRQIL